MNVKEDQMYSDKSHPKGLYVLFVTEMWERFSYYGMRALFVLFMTKALLFDKALGSEIYGSYTGLVYLTPLLGGYMADRYWGNRKSIIIGGVLMAIGQLFMFFAGTYYQEVNIAAPLMFTGLGFLIIGNGSSPISLRWLDNCIQRGISAWIQPLPYFTWVSTLVLSLLLCFAVIWAIPAMPLTSVGVS